MTTTNGGQGQEPGPEVLPQLNVVAQYIKDFSFENPNAPRSFASSAEAFVASSRTNFIRSPAILTASSEL